MRFTAPKYYYLLAGPKSFPQASRAKDVLQPPTGSLVAAFKFDFRIRPLLTIPPQPLWSPLPGAHLVPGPSPPSGEQALPP